MVGGDFQALVKAAGLKKKKEQWVLDLGKPFQIVLDNPGSNKNVCTITIQYALGQTKPVLTYDDLKIDSPYNTYKHAGLTPTPISNPGLAALQAAAAPAAVDYLYYVARNDGTGRHYFSNDYQQFLADKAKANAQ